MSETLYAAQIAIYCKEYSHAFNGMTKSDMWKELTRQPQFEVLIQLLTFYQSYRMLEHSLFRHLPVFQHRDLFKKEIIPQNPEEW